jgi:hypothetical protein
VTRWPRYGRGQDDKGRRGKQVSRYENVAMAGRVHMASRIAKMVKRATMARRTRYPEGLLKTGWQK